MNHDDMGLFSLTTVESSPPLYFLGTLGTWIPLQKLEVSVGDTIRLSDECDVAVK